MSNIVDTLEEFRISAYGCLSLSDPNVWGVFGQSDMKTYIPNVRNIYLHRPKIGPDGIVLAGDIEQEFVNLFALYEIVTVFIKDPVTYGVYVMPNCGVNMRSLFNDGERQFRLYTLQKMQTEDEYNMSKALM